MTTVKEIHVSSTRIWDEINVNIETCWLAIERMKLVDARRQQESFKRNQVNDIQTDTDLMMVDGPVRRPLIISPSHTWSQLAYAPSCPFPLVPTMENQNDKGQTSKLDATHNVFEEMTDKGAHNMFDKMSDNGAHNVFDEMSEKNVDSNPPSQSPCTSSFFPVCANHGELERQGSYQQVGCCTEYVRRNT